MNRLRNSPFLAVAALGLLAAVFAAGAVTVLDRRASSGDTYPHYASYRSDPLGTSALYESFARMEGYEVSRNTTFLNAVEGLDAETCLILAGLPRARLADLRGGDDSPVIEALEKGARLVVAVNPGAVSDRFQPARSEEEREWLERRRRLAEEREEARERRGKRRDEKTGQADEARETDEADEAEDPDEAEEADESEESDEALRRLEDAETAALGPRLTARWGFALRERPAILRPPEGWETELADELPFASPGWHSPLYFGDLGEEWRVVLERGGDPVVVERPLGEGSVVLASDSYFLSNEALHLGTDPELLLWLVGGKRRLVFDETIHGSQESGGAMKLLRRHRLHGIVVGLLGFVLLWGWRSASSLAPGSEEIDAAAEGPGGAVAGAAQAAGFISLLRRSVPPPDLLGRCYEIWRHARIRELGADERKRVEELLAVPDRDAAGLLARYREIAAALRKR